MRCPFRMDTAAYALGILAPGDRERMTVHLEECPSCRADVADFAGILRALASLVIRPPGDATT
ncbi:zf-HC2 domain-containing protein [Actinomadura sp. SCN-SB]|uniref:zf-HC2 domain-containing protein n=1 Tax=Actinomadura sp. SCN-SB TaxID=3373092 RepID=UPI003753D97D